MRQNFQTVENISQFCANVFFWRNIYSVISEQLVLPFLNVYNCAVYKSIQKHFEAVIPLCCFIHTFAYTPQIYGPWSCIASVNTLRPRQNGRHFQDDIFKCIFVSVNIWISTNILLKIVPKILINNIPALDQIMAWRRPGDKPLSEPMLVSLLTHICVTRPQWVKCHVALRCLNRNRDPFQKRIFARYSDSIDILLCCNSIAGHQIATNVCRCHDNRAVVPCKKYGSHLLESSWEWNEISIEFEKWWKTVSETWALVLSV